MGRGVFNRENIATPSKFGSRDGCTLRGGKVPMLKVCETRTSPGHFLRFFMPNDTLRCCQLNRQRAANKLSSFSC